jgi:glycosyltransferase involved in cell wall biosynthesis
MCCGVPVVGSSAGEIPWVIETTGGGIIFPEGDQRALRAALLRLRESPELRARLASEGRARAESIFGVRAVGGRLAEAIDALVGEPARAVLR